MDVFQKNEDAKVFATYDVIHANVDLREAPDRATRH